SSAFILLETVNNLPVHSVNYLTGLYRLCPPKGSYEFAEVLRVSEAYFARRAESPAPTVLLKSPDFA
ncbi:hypothetical protein, partial [Oscillospiraceae bacterium]